MPPHASLSLSLCLSGVVAVSLSSVPGLSCLSPPPPLLFSWSVCWPYLAFQTTTASCTSCTLSSPLSLPRTLAMVPAAFYSEEWQSFKSSRLAGSPCDKKKTIQTFGSAPSLSTSLVINRPWPSRPREALFSSILPLHKSNYGEADFSDSLDSLYRPSPPPIFL
ncbi:hypothetical protein BDP81DRAFT_32335 [Colletotrichum phormii]|uniref:Secreted protein n=1 Tax=Colletotrichum phormii TaxID=359342 RepID=A0AAI9ZPX9_9PEZI|nr:uncharacterized protein BDP81DRAFT_32335 [Colletotrichum phormii]KAK1636004.1 hypothetical protein BDP81DRAFT_32335 [Colletotrichum phormii]